MQNETEQNNPVLIVGLGNPGISYALTRHNLGHAAVASFAKSQGWTWKKHVRLNGKVASGFVHGRKIYLLLPSTYMNNSGLAVRRCVEYFKIEGGHLLVVADDIHLPFGKFRFREKGGDGGHNGLKSIEAHLHTPDYARLRMGVGNTFIGHLADYVLSPFNEEELENMPLLLKEAEAVIDLWIKGDRAYAAEVAAKAHLPTVQGDNE